MARKIKKLGEKRAKLNLGDFTVPVRIILERGRSNFRASVTSKALIIRVPDFVRGDERKREIDNMLEWARKTYVESPAVFAHFKPVELAGAYTFSIRDDVYQIEVVAHQFKYHIIKDIGGKQLLASVNAKDPAVEQGKVVPKLLAKHFARVYLPETDKRVRELNELHFQRPINSVKLSDTTSRWGSCSSKGNINLSSRLLLAPLEVLDAVIIHELAHLVEANHSSRFWAQVARVLPDYKVYDRWLKDHGKSLSFRPEVVG